MVKIPKGLGGTAKQLGSNLLEITYACYLKGWKEGSEIVPKSFLEFSSKIREIHAEGQKIRRSIKDGANL